MVSRQQGLRQHVRGSLFSWPDRVECPAMRDLLNRIVCGDCVEILTKIDRPFADLIFADPPFNIGSPYDKYHDKVKRDRYIAWTRDWMATCRKVLKPHGSFYVAIGDDYAAHIRIIGEDLGLTCRNWIIWHYTFGQQTRDKFARAHTHIFYFVNDRKRFTFNDWAVRVPSDRQLIYDDRRADPKGKMPDDVWDEFSRVCGTFKERAGWHPCQMPENLLKRIVAVSSNPGDCVLDPFSGSGTTAAAACQLGRSYVGLDISETYVERARRRLAEVKTGRQGNFFLTREEMNELERLLSDMRVTTKHLSSDPHLLRWVTNQFRVRMRSKKDYQPEQVTAGLKEMA